MEKRSIRTLVCILLVISVMASVCLPVLAAYTYPQSKTESILSTIRAQYGSALEAEVRDLLYASDYSDLLSDKTTLRSKETIGKKAFPITNADSFGWYVVDRGERIDFNWGGAGCFAYALFFSCSVYGTKGVESNRIYLSSSAVSDLKEMIKTQAQPGEHMRINGKHSVVFLCEGTENGQEGFYIAEYWGGGTYNSSTKSWAYSERNDQYYLKFYTYEDFIQKYSGYQFFLYNAYETSDYVKQSTEPPASEKTRDVVLVLDRSTSMRGEKFTNTKTAAKRFVEQILDASKTTQIAVVDYGSNVTTATGLTSDQETLYAAVDGIALSGSTNIYAALTRADSILAQGSGEKKAIVIMTDGAANQGATATAGNRVTAEGDTVYFDRYGSAIYDLALSYTQEKGYTVYSLGFGLNSDSKEYNLMKYISSFSAANERYFWAVDSSNIDDIVFTFEDIADSISTKRSIVITIECPVDVVISKDGESLSRSNLSASFGTLTVTELGENDYQYLFNLEDSRDYDISVRGLADGAMNLSVTYGYGDERTICAFQGVTITPATKITTTATDWRADFGLYIDSDGDGEIDETWVSLQGETANAPSDSMLKEIYPDEQPLVDAEDPDADEDDAPVESVLPPFLLLPGLGVAASSPYQDVSPDDWFYDNVVYVTKNGLMNGTGSGCFNPYLTTTRGMIVTVLYRMEGSPDVYGGSAFEDVAAGSYYADAVAWAEQIGIVNGFDETRFGPDQDITREQLVSIIYRYAAYLQMDVSARTDLTQYADCGDISGYAKESVSWAIATGLLGGKGNGILDPAGEAVRCEVAAILQRFDETLYFR